MSTLEYYLEKFKENLQQNKANKYIKENTKIFSIYSSSMAKQIHIHCIVYSGVGLCLQHLNLVSLSCEELYKRKSISMKQKLD